MAKNVFFSFHYDDVVSFRANVVRNSGILKRNAGNHIFSDGSIWEESKSKDPSDLKKLIQKSGLYGTSISVVLIGEKTSERRWVKYELVKSFEKGNGIIGIHINRIRGKNGYITQKGNNPLDKIGFYLDEDSNTIMFYEVKNGKWVPYIDLKTINNKKSNSIYFEKQSSFSKFLNGSKFNKFYKFSDFFETYCWVNDNGNENFEAWIEKAHPYITI